MVSSLISFGLNLPNHGEGAAVNIDPMVPVIRRILGDVELMRPLKSGIDCLDSGPFLNVCFVSLKSVPFAFYGDRALVKEFDNEVSCRLRYLEAAFMATASLVYNFVFATAFTVLSLVTLAQFKVLIDQMRKMWIHTALAAGSLVIGLLGTISPQLGIHANLAAGLAIGVVLFQWVESDVIRNISTAYNRHRVQLREAALQCVHGNNAIFHRDVEPIFDYLDADLGRAQSFSDFIRVVQGVRERVTVTIFASPNVLLENAMQLFDQYRSRQMPQQAFTREESAVTV